ncbi:MAG TPA: ATP-binding cassette domain-containing protein, partial [Coriobacteriia bacterium]
MHPLNAPALALRGITKRFGTVVANDSVDLDVRAGEVVALLGENGAGKSTLMRIAYGFERADSGSIMRDGTVVRLSSPQDGRRHGIGMLFQQFTLIPAFTVAENCALFLPGLPAVVDLADVS